MAKKRAIITIETNEKRAYALTLVEEGYTYKQIGQIMGVSQQTVYKYVRHAKELARERMVDLASKALMQQLEDIETLTALAMQRVDVEDGTEIDIDDLSKVADMIVKLQKRQDSLFGLSLKDSIGEGKTVYNFISGDVNVSAGDGQGLQLGDSDASPDVVTLDEG